MKCDCRDSSLGFKNWALLQEVACRAVNGDENGFAGVPEAPGVYCIRVRHLVEADPTKIIKNYCRSPLYKAFQTLDKASASFFDGCKFGQGWGWGYPTMEEVGNRIRQIGRFSVTASGKVRCPILYIGRSNNLRTRAGQLISWAHTVNQPLWALLFSEWTLEIAFRRSNDEKKAENRLKSAFRKKHGGMLPPLMTK